MTAAKRSLQKNAAIPVPVVVTDGMSYLVAQQPLAGVD
jgi:hypothetical protein